MTPTQFLRQAAHQSGWIVTPVPWQDKYAATSRADMCPKRRAENGMTEVGFPDPSTIGPIRDDRCWLCGGETGGIGVAMLPTRKETFTDGDRAKAPWSEAICAGCAWATTYMELRMFSYIATDDGLAFPARSDWRKLLLAPPPARYLAVISVSGQKWLHFKGRIATSGPWTVQLEDHTVTVGAAFPSLLRAVETLYTGGFTKTEIETGQYQSHRIQAFGLEAWEEHERQIERHRGSRLFDLAIYVAQKEAER